MQRVCYNDKVDNLLLLRKKISKEKKLPLIFSCHPKIIFHYTKSGRGENNFSKPEADTKWLILAVYQTYCLHFKLSQEASEHMSLD